LGGWHGDHAGKPLFRIHQKPRLSRKPNDAPAGFAKTRALKVIISPA
jgi:hypothetical protein